MKIVSGKLRSVSSVKINGIGNLKAFDHNAIIMNVKITDGPSNFLDRVVHVPLSVSELVDALPADFASQLRRELNERADTAQGEVKPTT